MALSKEEVVAMLEAKIEAGENGGIRTLLDTFRTAMEITEIAEGAFQQRSEELAYEAAVASAEAWGISEEALNEQIAAGDIAIGEAGEIQLLNVEIDVSGAVEGLNQTWSEVGEALGGETGVAATVIDTVFNLAAVGAVGAGALGLAETVAATSGIAAATSATTTSAATATGAAAGGAGAAATGTTTAAGGLLSKVVLLEIVGSLVIGLAAIFAFSKEGVKAMINVMKEVGRELAEEQARAG